MADFFTSVIKMFPSVRAREKKIVKTTHINNNECYYFNLHLNSNHNITTLHCCFENDRVQ